MMMQSQLFVLLQSSRVLLLNQDHITLGSAQTLNLNQKIPRKQQEKYFFSFLSS